MTIYSREYDSPGIRSTTYNTVSYIRPLLKKDMIAVDLGCGTCKKSIEIAKNVSRIDCVDISSAMLKQAKINITKTKTDNIRLCKANNIDVPLPSHSYNLCTAFLTTWIASEAYRLLSQKGLLIIETLDAEDKIEMKKAFGKDNFGWRGCYLNQTSVEKDKLLLMQLDPFFHIQAVKKITFETFLSKDDLIKLLKVTPTVRDFSLERDGGIVEELTLGNIIRMVERRTLVFACTKYKA